MFDVAEFFRKKVIYWTTTTAFTLVGIRMFTPNFADFIIDFLSAGLVWIAATMAKADK